VSTSATDRSARGRPIVHGDRELRGGSARALPNVWRCVRVGRRSRRSTAMSRRPRSCTLSDALWRSATAIASTRAATLTSHSERLFSVLRLIDRVGVTSVASTSCRKPPRRARSTTLDAQADRIQNGVIASVQSGLFYAYNSLPSLPGYSSKPEPCASITRPRPNLTGSAPTEPSASAAQTEPTEAGPARGPSRLVVTLR